MRIAVLGTGLVGRTIATGLVAAGHEVRLGSRTPDNAAASAWAREVGEGATHGTFADAAAFADLVFHAAKGEHALAVLHAAGADNLAGKVLVDVANPLSFVGGSLRLTVCNDDSLAETIQRAHPEARVVKSLNTVNAGLMTDPGQLPEPTVVFVAGDDPAARAEVADLLRTAFGWQEVLDLGALDAARALEMWLPLWLKLMQAQGTPAFNLKLVRADPV